MKGSEAKLVAYMQGPSKRFVIPVYQRNYDWKTENCKQLFNDLIKVVRNGRKSHFFGSIVSVYNPDGVSDEFLIIDGQQRLATVSILLLAMYNLIEEKRIVPEQATLSELIYEQYLIDKYREGEERIKLKPVKDDSAAFQKLFKDAGEHQQGSNLTVNYNYFVDRLLEQEVTPDELFDAICRLEIINITLNQDDNPQLIFESLNSTGVALSEGDKIRNFILMGLPTNVQNKYYEDYWHKIEICTNYDVSAFVRDYLSIKEQAIPPQSRVYQIFKTYVEDHALDIEPLLNDLLAYARRYEVLLQGNTPNRELNATIYRLNRLETTVTRPFFLEVLRIHAEEKITYEELTEIFRITENYLFRRTMCELPTNALNKIFLMLHREVTRYDGTDADYVNKLKYAILSKKDRVRFPDDEEFAQAFSNRPVYLMNSKNKTYILERIENYGTLEDKDVYRHLDDETYTIEHIMPQNLTPAWTKSLGEDVYEQIHETWLHRIANLTLTAYNARYSNNTFHEKKTMKNGFIESGIKMNMYIAQYDKWTLEELETRDQYLTNRALEIWSSPKTEYKPAVRDLDFYTLDDDADLSGRQIAKFYFKNIEQPVESWIDMYERVLRILHTEDKSILSQLAYAPEDADLASYFSNDMLSLRSSLEIEDGLYAERGTSTSMKISVLRRLFKLYGEDAADLVFYLKEEGVDAVRTDEAARHTLRRKYWEHALPVIQTVHEGGAFSNVNPTKDNWIAGFFGVYGASLVCVANYDEARVELQFYNSDSVRNKELFDKVYLHKAEIENTLRAKLEWDRGDEKKSSKVFVSLKNISVSNESDWPNMARFHAEWTRKFYDVIVPYLKNA
jgi:uncharacterized protein with ParB-like and HNH nuclease domain